MRQLGISYKGDSLMGSIEPTLELSRQEEDAGVFIPCLLAHWLRLLYAELNPQHSLQVVCAISSDAGESPQAEWQSRGYLKWIAISLQRNCLWNSEVGQGDMGPVINNSTCMAFYFMFQF